MKWKNIKIAVISDKKNIGVVFMEDEVIVERVNGFFQTISYHLSTKMPAQKTNKFPIETKDHFIALKIIGTLSTPKN